MNFEKFERLFRENSYDEIRIIGKDIEIDGQFIYIIGMTLKDGRVSVYALEEAENYYENEDSYQKIENYRQQLKECYSNEDNSILSSISEFHSNGEAYKVESMESCVMESFNTPECMIFFMSMREKGWKISENSYFYDKEWERLTMSVFELENEVETLPEWEKDLEVICYFKPKTKVLEIPITLTLGENTDISFKLNDKTVSKCYINNIFLMDVWEEQEARFEDEEYKNKMLKFVTKEEFMKMKEQCDEALLKVCPKGKCYMVLEYECDSDVALNFYATSYLDSEIEIGSENAVSTIFMHYPDKKVGANGLKLQSCVIQVPLERDATTLEAELFSYSKRIKACKKKLY